MGSGQRILTVFGTRPEAIKLFPLIHALEADDRFEARVCVSAQHRSMLDQVLSISGVRPHHDLDLMTAGQTLDMLTSRALTGIGRVLDKEKPDWVVVQGDTTTALAGALAAYYRQIPICHVEAGLRSSDIYRPWPEEGNRRMIGSIAALHCAPTQSSADALLAERVDPASVHVTGNTVIDALHWVTRRIAREPVLATGLSGMEARFAGRKIIAMTSHRRENLGNGMQDIADAVKTIAERSDVAVIFPVHLNPDVRAVMSERLGALEHVALIEPLDYPHFARLLDISHLVLTDSGGVQEEAPALGKPVLVMRETTERPEGVAAGTARLVGTCTATIVRETERLLDDPDAHAAMARAHNPFGDGKSSQRICDLLAG
jgi:UDP-N-acetylglucosamine 2-epimerase (non-hydrolysing)